MVDGLIKVTSDDAFETVLERAVEAIEKRNIRIFAILDHKKNAESVGMEMGNATVIIFGNPEAGTKLMQDRPSIAIDLPLRLLISSEDGKTALRYYNPLHLAKEHKLNDNLDLINKLSGLLNAIVMEAAGKA
ncbi:DUF302 domain-containing protein [Candidatus Marsarchaeota archaeon]|nr:DUF302 domain-containing protein [Candidatus Marsarchaeota archaeon]MCL5404352.1 DUF302 domain-containing protein [Candidatus Marsarchaeota archaeon]